LERNRQQDIVRKLRVAEIVIVVDVVVVCGIIYATVVILIDGTCVGSVTVLEVMRSCYSRRASVVRHHVVFVSDLVGVNWTSGAKGAGVPVAIIVAAIVHAEFAVCNHQITVCDVIVVIV
jgi:hypothetical protein